MSSFSKILTKYRKISFSERDKGHRFERLMQAYLRTDPKYAPLFKHVWLWNVFPWKVDFGGKDIGIDIVALTHEGEYWAVQCKCFQESSVIDKEALDSFLSTSGKKFSMDDEENLKFSQRLWISTTNKWSSNATQAIKNQDPPVIRLGLHELIEAPVDWEKLDKNIYGEAARNRDRSLLAHQKVALEKSHEYYKKADRGKLIMACGTGKTFNSLRIAEYETKGNGLILFLVPSIALLGQILREWTTYADKDIKAICICSDPKVSQSQTQDEDSDNFSIVDLALPASTNVRDIIRQFELHQRSRKPGMTVVFSTYQSIDVISRAQKSLRKSNPKLGEFDLIICDEAHRTTGVTLSGEDESSFTKVHNNNFIAGKKRLYMTATPRLYSDETKSKAAQADAILCSMDDANLYGEEIYRIGFGEAVQRDLLTDYKVLILTLSDRDIPPSVQRMVSNQAHEINTDDASKLIGCINALSKQILGDEGIIKSSDPDPMRKAVAFCQSIKVSKKINDILNKMTDVYIKSLPPEKKEHMVSIGSRHIDGTMSSPTRDELLSWLKSEDETNECKILTNVRCLSEGVDVPSLDAVLFLSAKNSQVDVVQSVGRVMRKAPGKKYGYIIIPVIVPSDVEADKALDDNERYKVVWTVLNALRAHDDRFNATVNKIELNKKRPIQILIGTPPVKFGTDGQPTQVSDDSQSKYGASEKVSEQFMLQFQQLQSVVFARMVLKVGDRRYWEQWAKSVVEIADRHIERINRVIKQEGKHRKAFEKFLSGLQKNINPSISQQDAVEMLSQHIITKPVFETLFDGYSFVKNNPISKSMQRMLELLEAQAIEKDTETLQKFYDSVKMRAAGIDNAEGKQRIIIELYDKFFKTAFPKMVDRLGIVYTPVEVVDFIIHSVEDALKKEFGRSLSDENVHILDPFAGTGTFITRLIQSGLIGRKALMNKYKRELHANEIILLAYYIAAVNIENAFHDAMEEKNYIPFEGICLTDTFQLGESEDGDKLFSELFPQNSKRVQQQKKAPIRVIIGNPPYSVGQKSANDNMQNQRYPVLDSRILQTYARQTNAVLKNSLYDSYIRAFRWSTDRLDPKHGGIVCFVSNGSWLDGNSADGFRKVLEKEYTSIHIYNLRGNARTQGELRRREAGNVFGGGSRTPIAISLLVKNPMNQDGKANVYYNDIGDYLSRDEKLNIVKKSRSIGNVEMKWKLIKPNEHGDWISQRNDFFTNFFPIGDKDAKAKGDTIFSPIYSNGLKTSRDSWCYNFSRKKLKQNIKRSIDFYNSEVDRISAAIKKNSGKRIEDLLNSDSSKFTWDRQQKKDVVKFKKYYYEKSSIRNSFYRPFTREWVYFNRQLNNCVYLQPKLFPNSYFLNFAICIPGTGDHKDFSCLISSIVPDLGLLSACQCFPLYYYEQRDKQSNTLFDDDNDSDYIRHDGVSDFILNRAKKQYGKNVTKEDIFYYVYGFLHSPEYRKTFANDLKKMLPRLPLVDDVRDFWKFSKAGKELADLHINYEKVSPYKGVKVTGAQSKFFTVEKMRFPKKGQKDTIIYNSKITITDIPEKAYEYVVNGRSAIEWIMERYQITTHKESGIVNDPNDWADEVGNPSYILDLLLSIITVSMQTVEIVKGLPEVRFE